MAEAEKSGGGGEPSRVVLSKMTKTGDRQVFTVELRPGETTYVSWKKLVKDANRGNGSSVSVPEPPPNAHPNLQSRIAPEQTTGDEGKDEPAPNRFSAVIEKIERLYMGKDSSDEEELDDIPDDDQYDTEDSFIDDAELDEYFEVDNSAIKHDGFFVNRGKLERINEPPVIPNQQPKKRRRKDVTKSQGESDDGRGSTKHSKIAKSPASKMELSHGKSSPSPLQNMPATNEQYKDIGPQNTLNLSGTSSKKKCSELKMSVDPSSYLKVSNGDASTSMADVKDMNKPKMTTSLSKNITSNKLKDASRPAEIFHQKYIDKASFTLSKSQHGKIVGNINELEQPVQEREKNGNRELPDLNVPAGKYPMQTTKTSQIYRRDGTFRPKTSMLEKAIRELEKMVAESRPPAMENQEADSSFQGVKRRLPREIKLKLGKVARLAQASQGKVTKELLNRLMSILGHLIQLRTLKRNMKIMINMGLSAKQEKDVRFQQIKKEVYEMIKVRVPSLESKAYEQQLGASDNFRETGSEEKVFLKRKFSMDTVLEDRICDLYDLYLDGLDDDSGSQIRKLYVELAEMWPKGLMDNHGIKRAICRAKERRKAFNRHKDQEKMRKKKLMAPRLEENVRVDASSSAQAQHMRERLANDSTGHVLTSSNKPVFTTAAATTQMPNPSTNGSSLERVKQEKLKGTSINAPDEQKLADGVLTKKKVKRKPELDLAEAHLRPDKLLTEQGDDRHKPSKQPASLPQKPSLQPTVSPNLEQSS